MLPGR